MIIVKDSSSPAEYHVAGDTVVVDDEMVERGFRHLQGRKGIQGKDGMRLLLESALSPGEPGIPVTEEMVAAATALQLPWSGPGSSTCSIDADDAKRIYRAMHAVRPVEGWPPGIVARGHRRRFDAFDQLSTHRRKDDPA